MQKRTWADERGLWPMHLLLDLPSFTSLPFVAQGGYTRATVATSLLVGSCLVSGLCRFFDLVGPQGVAARMVQSRWRRERVQHSLLWSWLFLAPFFLALGVPCPRGTFPKGKVSWLVLVGVADRLAAIGFVSGGMRPAGDVLPLQSALVAA